MPALLDRQPEINLNPYAISPRRRGSITIPSSIKTESIDKSANKELPWWKLPATGFNVEGEIDCLLRIYQQEIQTGTDPSSALRLALNETKGNIQGYKFEYIMQRLLLPNPVTLHRVNNRLRLVNSLSLQSLEDITTGQERLGSVKRAVKKVEKHLEGEDGEVKMAVIQSPDGWSGLKMPDGKEIIYPDSQTYIYRKNADGTLEAFTVVSSMGFEEDRHFLAKLGKDKDRVGIGPDQKERIADIVEHVVLLSGKEAELGFVGVVDKIRETRQEIMNTDVARTIKLSDGRVEQRGFAEIYHDLKNERLLESDKYADEAIADFENFVLQSTPSLFPSKEGIHQINREELEQRLALSVVNVSRAVRGERALAFDEVFNQEPGVTFQTQNQNFLNEVAYMETLGGCNGGGGTAGVVNTGLGLRGITIGGRSESNSSSEKTVYCSKCQTDQPAGSCNLCAVCFPE